jgi:hypothetical protein
MVRDEDALERATTHTKHVRDFYYHLITYVFVCTLLVILDRRAGAGDQAVLGLDWAYWVILFWGFGVMGHAVSVFFGDRRVRKEYEHERERDREA